MNKLFLLIYIFSFNSYAFFQDNNFEKMLLHSVATREFCFCKYETFTADNLELKPTSQFITCKEEFFKILESSNDQNGANNKLDKTIRKDKNPAICTKAQIKDKLQEYKKAQSNKLDLLKTQIEDLLCEGNGLLKAEKNIVKRCREKLQGLVGEYEEHVHKGCQEEFVNNGRKRAINDCVERNIYEYLWKNHSNNYFVDFCPVDTNERKACVEDLRDKLKLTYFNQEVQYCHNRQNFHEKQVNAIIVCEDLLLSKLLSLATQPEMEALVNCMKPLAKNDQSGIKKCMDTFRNADDPAEQDLLKQLRDKYCDSKLYDIKYDQDACLTDLLNENMVDLNVDEKCKSQANLLEGPEKETAFKRCQRMASYQNLLDDKQLEVSDCWNQKKYTTMAARKECRDEAVIIDSQIRKCEKLTDSNQIIQCLNNIKNKDFLRQYLLTKAHKLGVDTASCSGTGDVYINCLLNLLHEQADKFGTTDRNACFLENPSGVCVNNQNNLASNNTTNGKNVDNKNLVTDNKTSNNVIGNVSTVAVVAVTGGVAAGSGLKGESLLSDSGKSSNTSTSGLKSSLMGGAEDSGMFGFLKDFGLLKLIRHPNPTCKAIGKAATLRVTGLVGGLATSYFTNKAIKKKLDEKKEKNEINQKDFMIGVKQTLGAAAAGLAVKMAFNQIANIVVKDAIKDEASKIASGMPPTVCSTAEKTSSTDHFQKWINGENRELYNHSIANQMSSAKNTDELISVLVVWDHYQTTDNFSSPTVEEFEKGRTLYSKIINTDNFNSLKTTFTYLLNGLLPSAYAEEQSKKDFNIDPMQMMNLLSMLQSQGFLSSKEGKNKDSKKTEKELNSTQQSMDALTVLADIEQTSTNDGLAYQQQSLKNTEEQNFTDELINKTGN
jgi:hypothetical protein